MLFYYLIPYYCCNLVRPVNFLIRSIAIIIAILCVRMQLESRFNFVEIVSTTLHKYIYLCITHIIYGLFVAKNLGIYYCMINWWV